MGKFEGLQEVILLDGTNLVGRIVEVSMSGDAYKVALSDSDPGRWYSEDELAEAPAAPQPPDGADVPLLHEAPDVGFMALLSQRLGERLAEISALEDERDALQAALAAERAKASALAAALEPFAKQWSAWQEFARNGGDVDIVEFFADSLKPEVLARWLKVAYEAQQAQARGAGEAE